MSGVSYLIEVKANVLSHVPKDWTKINSTKQVTRYQSPFIDTKVGSNIRSHKNTRQNCAYSNSAFPDYWENIGYLRLDEIACCVSIDTAMQVLLIGVNKERLKEAANEAWAEFLGAFADKYDGFRRVVKQLATLDCLFSLAHLATQSGYVRPIFGKNLI